jgi:drug/metabolite transporter (DMT)-like permease
MIAAVYLRQSWSDLGLRGAWPAIFYATLLIGVVFYALIFWAAKLTSPVNLALLGLMEVPLSFLLLRRYHTERVSLIQALGSALMVCGAVVIVFSPEMEINLGDILVLAACALPPFGNYYAKQARQLVGSEIILLLRSAGGGLILLVAALFYEGFPSRSSLVAGLPFIALAGLLPMGISKLLWTEAVHRLPIPKAVSSAALVPALTVVLSFIILGTYPTAAQLIALLPVCIGVVLAVR